MHSTLKRQGQATPRPDATKRQKLCIMRQTLRQYEEGLPQDTDTSGNIDPLATSSDRESNLRKIQVEMCTNLHQKLDTIDVHDIRRIIRCIYGRAPRGANATSISCVRPSMPFLCPSCQCHRIYNASDSQLSCPSCGLSVYYPDSTEGKTSQAACTTTTVGLASTQHVTYDRSQLYRKHLEQYMCESTDIPQSVIDVVKTSVGSTRATKCTPTMVGKILKEKQMSKWCKYSVRISRQLCERPMGRLPSLTFEKLMRRFKILVSAYNKDTQSRCKFLNFDFVTRQFLCMEGEHDLCKLFNFQKTKDVELRSEAKFSRWCELAAQETGDTTWRVFPSHSRDSA